MRALRRTKQAVATIVNIAYVVSTSGIASASPEREVRSGDAPAAAVEAVAAQRASEHAPSENPAVAVRPSEAPSRSSVSDELVSSDTRMKPSNQVESAPVTRDSSASNESATAVVTPMSLPSGADKTGVSSQSISVPQGTGKVQGMGESFSMQLSTGTSTFSVPFSLPAARGASQPSLALSYSASAGHSVVGLGWSVGIPFIARQTDRGLPLYQDPSSGGGWSPLQDRFVFNGGQELVPICLVTGNACTGALPLEQMPVWGNGWQYFRPRVEGSFLRFFWSPDHKTWRVQSKNGETLELGNPLDGTSPTGVLEVDPSAPSRVFRWNLSRQYDAQGDVNPATGLVRPPNVVMYRYMVDNGESYLTDIYDTPPADTAAVAPLTTYAHHTRLRYEWRPDVTTSYRRGWSVRSALRLIGVDVASKTFGGGAADARKVLRRYHLGYDATHHSSLLTTVEVEGRCGAGGEMSDGAIGEDASEGLPSATPCPRLPPMTFAYSHVTPYQTDGASGAADLAGFEGFDERITSMSSSPNHSLDEELTDLFDVNSDGLPDVVDTNAANYGGKHGVFFNGAQGVVNAFGADTIGIVGPLGETATTITLRNQNLSAGDLDGDGTIDLVHMPQVKTYSIYTPQHAAAGWNWVGRAVTTASSLSPKINFGRDGTNIARMDVNGDGLVDVVLTTGTQMQTFFSLGKYPGGDGQFGHAIWTSATTASISNDPVAACLPWAGTPIQLSDSSEIKVADMNGDGLADIVRVLSSGDIRYWPGRGDGTWGTGPTSACAADTSPAGREVTMTNAPFVSGLTDSDLRIDDINGDGFDDLVRVRQQGIDIWLNADGTSWTARHVISGTPASPSFQHRVRLVDMNGSGTRDILWGDGGHYRYIDVLGGNPAGLLTRVANGLGKTTDIEYASSTSQMLDAERAHQPWTSKMPLVTHVVSRVTDSDNLQVIGRPAGKYVTEYTYREPVYDGRQREFRGFRMVKATRIGDANSPSSSSQSTFLLGECEDEQPPGSLPSPCTFGGRWRDNPREALKGLPTISETFDNTGVYLSTAHTTYRLRHLYSGLDGREVRQAFASQTDSWLYDTATPDHVVGSVIVPEVEVEMQAPPLDWRWDAHEPFVPAQKTASVTIHGEKGRAHLHSISQVDGVGNAVLSRDHGCVDGDGCAARDDDIAHFTFPGLYPADASGWGWRNWDEYTLGYAGVQQEWNPRHHMFYSWDTHGSLTMTSIQVIGMLPLARANGIQPVGAMSDGQVVLVSYLERDGLGNVQFEEGANNRCRLMDLDPTYQHLVTKERVYVGPSGGPRGCGATELAAGAVYDRGFAAPTTVTDIHQETSVAAYDGFGRLVTLTKPDPDTPGVASPLPSTKIEYILPQDAEVQPYAIVHVRAQNGATPGEEKYHDSWAYADGMGRAILTLDAADPAHGDGGKWIVNGLTNYDAKGAPERAYLAWFYNEEGGDAAHFPLATTPSTAYSRQRYDGFGRAVQTFGLDGSETLRHAYHALSSDAWDAADLAPGQHQGTYASEAKDGHGRTVSVTERAHVKGKIERHETRTQYLSTGEPIVITRANLDSSDALVVRWMRYDSAGHMVVNVEPNTSKGFTAPIVPDYATVPDSIKAWRYAYNDAGDLVGTSDARGCGVNYHYEAGGRLVGEDYVPCRPEHPEYTAPNLATGEGFEVFNRYDAPDADMGGAVGLHVDSRWTLGRLVSVTDRSGKSITTYDGRGRVSGIGRRLTTPNGGLAPRWYEQMVTFDGADRPVTETTGAVDAPQSGEEAHLDVTSAVTTLYTERGTVWSVDSDHGALVNHVTHDADGLALEIQYADAAKTTTSFSYDGRRRLHSVQTYRGPPNSIWRPQSGVPAYTPAPNPDGPPSTFQLLLEDLDFSYDAVDNPTEIHDWRIPDEWPAGAKPVTRKMQYDDLYRVTRIDYQYANGDDTWVSPFDAENRGEDSDVRRAKPSPHVSFDKRLLWQSFQYDWLGNTVTTGDDARGFYDRSLGAITNGTAADGPYELRSATTALNAIGTATPPSGALSVAYDEAGNVTNMDVRRDGRCLPAGANCSLRFAYDWDEVGRLARARRWDEGRASVAAELFYVYDATDDRALKVAVDAQGNARRTAYPFRALELRGTTWDDADRDYARTPNTQVAYLCAHGARLGRDASLEEDLPALVSGARHVFVEVLDHLGSTGLVIDRDTSELIEASAYQGFGGAESDYRPERWKSFREDYRFTGKEDDIEVGLTYFGKRYYQPFIGRWASADPTTVHMLKADPNLYAYVSGQVLKWNDPQGLMPPDPRQVEASLETAWNNIPMVRILKNQAAGRAWREGSSPFPGERWAWGQAKDNALYQKLLDHYMDNSRTTYVLSNEEAREVRPIVDVTKQWGSKGELATNKEFFAKANELWAKATDGHPASAEVSFNSGAQANVGGTLGRFIISHTGKMTVSASGAWSFEGTMKFHDDWDFDPSPTSGRESGAETQTSFAAKFLPGSPFHIESHDLPVSQTSMNSEAQWEGTSPSLHSDPKETIEVTSELR